MKAIKLYCSVFSVCILFGLCFYALYPGNTTAEQVSDCGIYVNPACMNYYTCEYDNGDCMPPATHGGPDKLITWGGKFDNCTKCIVGYVCVIECTTGDAN